MAIQIVGYILVDPDGNEVQRWGGELGQCPGIPNPLRLNDDLQVAAAAPETSYAGYVLHLWEMDDGEP